MSSPGLKTLSKLQLAVEVTAGTPVTTATSKLTGMYKIEQQEMRTKIRPEELRGSMAKFFRTITVGKIVNLNLEGTATFEDLGYFLGMAFKKGVTGSTDGGTPPAYTYAYTPTLTDQDVPETYTIQYGDNLQAYYSEYCFAKSLTLDVQIDSLTKLTAALVGRSRTTQAFTGALSDRTTEDMIANNFIVYLDDASGGTIGTTAFSTGVVGLTWTMSNFMPDKTIDGTLVFTSTVEQPLAAEVTMTAELNTATQTKLAKFTGDTRQLMRLECSNATAIHGSVFKRLRLDGAYNLTDWGPIGSADHNGIQTVQLKFTGEYDPTYAAIAKAELVNAVSA